MVNRRHCASSVAVVLEFLALLPAARAMHVTTPLRRGRRCSVHLCPVTAVSNLGKLIRPRLAFCLRGPHVAGDYIRV